VRKNEIIIINAGFTRKGDTGFMIINMRRRRLAVLAVFHACAWSMTAYFVQSAYTGDRGLVAKQEARLKTEHVIEEIEALRAERVEWERRVNQLSGKQIDRDLLDERQRIMLGTVHKNDVVILLDDQR